MYKQLVQPDLSVVGHIAYCLKYADNVAGLTHGEQTAHIAWLNTRHPHTDPIPTDVAVPCWFDYWLGGVNLGHVVWSIPGQGFYSSPHTATWGHDVMSSIAEVERLYGVTYVGWSEDITELNVIEETINMSVTIVGAPGSVSWGEDRIDTFARGSDDGLWHKWFDADGGWRDWERLGGGIASAPSASSWAKGRLDVFCTGIAGDMMHFWFDTKWNGPESLGQPVK